MESEWRDNVFKFGLSQSSVRLIARLVVPFGPDDLWADVGLDGYAGVLHDNGPGQPATFRYAVYVVGAGNYPYGRAVHPD